MTLYTRRQLLVLLLLLVAAGLGLAIGHWRRANPDLVEQVEPRRARRSRAPREAPFTPNAATQAAPRPEDIDRNPATEVEPTCW